MGNGICRAFYINGVYCDTLVRFGVACQAYDIEPGVDVTEQGCLCSVPSLDAKIESMKAKGAIVYEASDERVAMEIAKSKIT